MSTIRRHTASRLRMAVAAFCALAGVAAHASITIDDFSTNQSTLTLTFPPAGTSASSSTSGAGILGGERDMQLRLTSGVINGNTISGVVSSGFLSYSQDATIGGNIMLQWDGTDGSPTLNASGLGGVDLTQGGSQDALALSVFFDDLPLNATLTVYTDAGNASTATVALPGLIFSSTTYSIPFAQFTPSLGSGADFTHVGAITLNMGSLTTAPDVVIDVIQTTATLAASQTVALQTDADTSTTISPGDTLRYTLVVQNPADPGGAAATAVIADGGVPAGTTLVAGSVSTTQGTVTTGDAPGDGAVSVNVGTIGDGNSVTITYDVLIGTPAAVPETLSSQAQVRSSSLTLATDPLLTPVVAGAVLSATKSVTGHFAQGGAVTYTIGLRNTGNAPQGDNAGDEFTDVLPASLTLTGAVSSVGVTSATGNTVHWNGALGVGATATITINATVNAGTAGQTISNQGSIAFDANGDGTNESTGVTSDPGQAAANAPTTFVVAAPPAPAAVLPAPALDLRALVLLGVALAALGALRRRSRRV